MKILLLIVFLILFYLWETDYNNRMEKATSLEYSVTLSYLPNFNSKEDYKNYFYLIDVISPQNRLKNLPQSYKISLKIRQLGMTPLQQITNFMKILEYAREKNVFIWISTTIPEDIEDEYKFYQTAINNGFTNIGLTVATNHQNSSKTIDSILQNRGHIRLVKGYYHNDEMQNWNQVTEIYKKNAEKLLQSDNYHVIATHDFDILDLLYKKYGNSHVWEKIEFGFFYSSLNFIQNQNEIYKIQFPNKSLYIPYGRIYYYLLDNIMLLDWKNIIKRKVNSIFYVFKF